MKFTARFSIVMAVLLSAQADAGFMDALNKIAEDVKVPTDVKSVQKLSTLDESVVADGLKEALKKGTDYAVAELGKEGGFLQNANVKIPLPEKLQLAEKALRQAGMGKYADDFIVSMNKAAETAVPETAKIFADTISGMTMEDAKNVLAGSDNAATQYLQNRAGMKIEKAILPIVTKHTDETDVTTYYKSMIGAYDKFGGKQLVESSGLSGMVGMLTGSKADTTMPEPEELDDYVTHKAVQGLFFMIAEEEKKIRENPVERTTDLLKQVFGQ